MPSGFTPRPFGHTGLSVGALGLGSSFGLPAKEVERAFERGVNFFLWGSLRKNDFGRGLRNLAPKHRAEMVVAVQSYTRLSSLMEWSVDRALRFLKTDYVDVLCLAWWNGPPPRRIVDAALELREKGKVRALMVSCHHRPAFQGFIADPAIDALMLRYNAAHPGAEREVFPHLAARRPGTVAFTATRWGTLLDSQYVPEGAATPRASDCYRFALSNPNVDVCLAGPKDAEQLDEALVALDRGPMDEQELAWMRRVGAAVREGTLAWRKGISPMDLLDKLASFSLCGPKQLTPG
ncbi:MAG TPA: aldo/keto reductase [Labilithrix sp.]|nr:aldo/keto reductase [Labilithrix sp.]